MTGIVDRIQRGICIVIWRHDWDWYRYSATLHSNRSNHEVGQAEVEKNEVREWTLKIKEEVKKQYNAGFLRVVNYLEWLANVVPVSKKDGKVRMCVDFWDLNKASPKDDFSLPHIDILVDNITGHALLSFMDGFSGYNQIKMASEDMNKTSFITL